MDAHSDGKLERVSLGCHVHLELIARSGAREALTFDLVTDSQADYQAGFLGESALLARAILGESPGAVIPYFTDDLQAIEIISISDSIHKIRSETASQRQANIQEAKNQIEFRDAILFASSANTKWGGYDADGLDYGKWKSQAQVSADDEEAKI